MLAPPHLQATTTGEVDPSFCPALVLSNSDRTAPDLGMVASFQSSRWKRVTSSGERSWGGRGGEGHVNGGDVGLMGMERERWGGCIAMDLVLQSGHITVCSGCLSHILPTSVFKADLDSNIAFAACQTSYKVQACQVTLSSEPLHSPPPPLPLPPPPFPLLQRVDLCLPLHLAAPQAGVW